MLQYDNFNHKGILIEIGDVPDALTDIRAKTPFRWQKTADDRLVFVCVERKIVEVFDTTGKLADNNIRTAYIGQEVDEEFNGDPCLRYMSYVEFDPKHWDIFPFDKKAWVANFILEVAKDLTNGEGEASLPDIDSNPWSYEFYFFVSDNHTGNSDKCLEKNLDFLFDNNSDIYEDFLPPLREGVEAYREQTDDYFAPYRLEWYIDDFDEELAEDLQAKIDDGTMDKMQRLYDEVSALLKTYSTRMVLEQGVFILLEGDCCAAVDDLLNGQDYLAYAIDKFLQTTTEEYINEHQEGAVNQLNALKEYFGKDTDFEWIKEVPSDHTEFIPTLKRLSAALGNDYQESPMEELESAVKRWASNIRTNDLFEY